MGSSWRVRHSAVLLSALVWLVVPVQPAAAHDWGPFGGVPFNEEPRFADNEHHTFCNGRVTERTHEAYYNARVYALGEPTDMITSYEDCVAGTDVWVYDGIYGQGWYGMYECKDEAPNGSCYSSWMRIDREEAQSYEQRRKTSCHEIGHSVGLRHFANGSPGPNNSNTSCMVSGPYLNSYYSSHEEGHINDRY